MKPRCAIYARVSLEEQTKQFGLESQLAELRAATLKRGYSRELEFRDEGYSGADLSRPGLSKLRQAVRDHKVEVVLFHDPDRLARNLSHQLIISEEIERAGVKLEFVTTSIEDSPEGRMFFNLKGVFAEYEREKIKDRTTRGRLQKAREGFIVGGRRPFGYNYTAKSSDSRGGAYTINESEALLVRQMFEWIAAGRSARSLVTEFNRQGHVSSRGGPWAKSSILKILRNPLYVGLAYYNKGQAVEPTTPKPGHETRHNKKTARRVRPKAEWIQVRVPAIVDQSVFDAVQSQLQRNLATLRGRNTRHFYLLRGLLRCGKCGRTFAGCPSRGNRFYRCLGRDRTVGGCSAGTIYAARIEAFVWTIVRRLLSDQELVIGRLRQFHRGIEAEASTIRRQIADLERLSSEIERQEMRVLDAYAVEGISLEVFDRKAKELAARKKAALDNLNRYRRQLGAAVDPVGQEQRLRQTFRQMVRGLSHLGDEGRQQLLRALLDRVTLDGNNVHIRGILPAGVGKRAQHADGIAVSIPRQSYVFSIQASLDQPSTQQFDIETGVTDEH